MIGDSTMESEVKNTAAENTAKDVKKVVIGNPLKDKVVKEAVEETKKLLEAAKKQASAKKGSAKGSTKTGEPKKDKGPTMASELDKIILKGGTFEEMIAAAQERSKKLGGSIKYNKGVIKAHITYREKKNPKYLGNLKQTETGIFEKPAKKAKKVA